MHSRLDFGDEVNVSICKQASNTIMCLFVCVQELSQLRVAKVTGGAASKLSKM